MANLTNPEAFQFEAATILAAAYTAFPVPFDWALDEDAEGYPTTQGHGRKEIQNRTLEWLEIHRYLGSDSVSDEDGWYNLKLTERGLAALNAVPDVLSGREPLGKRLAVAVGRNSLDVIKQLIPTLISQALGGEQIG